MHSRDFTRNPEYPQFVSDLKWKKAERAGGRKEWKDRTREMRKGGRFTRKHDEHKRGKRTKG